MFFADLSARDICIMRSHVNECVARAFIPASTMIDVDRNHCVFLYLRSSFLSPFLLNLLSHLLLTALFVRFSILRTLSSFVLNALGLFRCPLLWRLVRVSPAFFSIFLSRFRLPLAGLSPQSTLFPGEAISSDLAGQYKAIHTDNGE